jgi:hypothetical protein
MTPLNSLVEDMVTPEMIEAGVSFIYGMDHNFGETSERRCDLDVLRGDLRDLATAMEAARLSVLKARMTEDGPWQPIETAPGNTPVFIQVGERMAFAARLVPDASHDKRRAILRSVAG